MGKLLAGTSKGLVVFDWASGRCTFESTHFLGLPVSFVFVDERSSTWWIGVSHRHWGSKLHFSRDYGKSWIDSDVPSYQGYEDKRGVAASLRRMWIMQHAGTDRLGCLWIGTEPGGLFYSDDDGKQFNLVESLWMHPSRTNDNQWFGAGKDDPFIHSIVVDPRNSDHLYVGVSCAGIFESIDGGKSWKAKNKGLKAAYLPNPLAELGHDPHCVMAVKKNPVVLWQQNHCGIFRTTNGGDLWEDVSGNGGFPKYGFALAIDDQNAERAWVIPAHSDEIRVPVDLKLTVCRTRDGGKTWQSLNRGLPTFGFGLVLRQGLLRKDGILAFGTTDGCLYTSRDDGESWEECSNHMAAIQCLAAG